MERLDLDADTDRLLLNITTSVLVRSFNKLPEHDQKRFVKKAKGYVKDSNRELELKRRLWDIKDVENSEFNKIILRCDVIGTGRNRPTMIAKTGITRKIGGANDLGLAISYGWHHDARIPKFEKNFVEQMNHVTDGVKLYYSTPGEKSGLAKINGRNSLRNRVK